MKTLICVMLLWLYGNVGLTQTKVITIADYTKGDSSSEDPNLNPNWDWETGDTYLEGVPHYWIYYQDKPNAIQEYAALPPWRQQSSWTGLSDRKKEDGWILLARDFGTTIRRLEGSVRPYFILYNKYRSIIRVFILLRNVTNSFTFSTMECKTYHKGSGALAHLSSTAYATDKNEKMFNNATSAVIPSLAQSDYWVYGDFPLAYDNTLASFETTEIPASLKIDVYGTILTDIKLEMNGFGAQGDKKFIQDFMSKNNYGSPGFSLNNGTLPNMDIPFTVPNVSMKISTPDWDAMKRFFSDLKVDLNINSMNTSSPFKDLFEGFYSTLSALSIASPLNIAGLDLGGIFKFFIAGGVSKNNIVQTAPTFISSHYSATGTMTTKNRFASVTIPIPASRSNYKSQFNGGSVGLVYNEPVGILTLKKTPIVYKKSFPYTIKVNSQYAYCPMYELELAEIPEIVYNERTDIELKKCEINMVTPFRLTPTAVFPPLSGLDVAKKIAVLNYMTGNATRKTNQRVLIEFDTPIHEAGGYFRSLAVPAQFSKGRTLQVPQDNMMFDVKLRIKAVFKRKDDPNAQPIVFIATYHVDVVERNDLPSEQILPTVPPQAVVCNIPSSGGVIISWDRNPEKNIKNYNIERSINYGTWIQIGTTADSMFTDNEVQKSVKPYLSNRQNVSVRYRVRAKSEWMEDDGSLRSQFSNYSSIVNISGSIIDVFEKQALDRLVPQSNSISQNFPNPFNPATTIHYGVKDEGLVTIKIFNSLGQEIATLVNDTKEIGYHYTEWNAAGLPSGIYFYQIKTGQYTETRKMMLMK